MNEIRSYSFAGHAIPFEKRDGEWWVTADALAPALGYRHGRSVRRLYQVNEQHFQPGESRTIKVPTIHGSAYHKRAFSPEGAIRLCGCCTRQHRAGVVREWLQRVIAPLRASASAQQLEALRSQNAHLGAMNKRLLGQMAASQRVNRELADMARTQVHLHAQTLEAMGEHPTPPAGPSLN